MEYPQKIMKIRPLSETTGYSVSYLRKLYFYPKQDFAHKLNPDKPNSPIVYDTDKFDRFMSKLGRLDRAYKEKR